MFALAACAKNPEQRLLEGHTTLRGSLTISKDTIIWPADEQIPGLTIESENPVVLDFGGAVVQSSVFGESPDQYRGLAILLHRAPSVTIRNVTFCGFQRGILAEAVDQIHLENCRFIDFRRASSTLSVAVQIKQSGKLFVEQCRFQHLDRAIQIDESVEYVIRESQFYWLNQQILQASTGSSGDFINNNGFYIGEKDSKLVAFEAPGTIFQQNNWAHILNTGLNMESLLEQGNTAAYVSEVPGEKRAETIITPLLREIGISAPGLRLRDEYGWYDFSYPRVWLRESSSDKDIYLLTAPNGNWRLIGGHGYEKIVPKTGNFPSTLQAFRSTANAVPSLEFEYLGEKIRKYGVYPVQISPISFSTDQ